MPAPEEQLPLFVYGTLRQGESNHDWHLGGRFLRVVTACLTQHVRRVGHHGYFVVVPAAGEQVEGELFFLDPVGYSETLERCDRLEEIPPGALEGAWYARRVVTVESGTATHRAWVYLQADNVD